MQNAPSPAPASTNTRYLTKTTYHTRAELQANSPSLKDGVPTAKENTYRKACIGLLTDVMQRLKLPNWVLWSAATFCNRYYALRSYTKTDRFYLASAAVLLACKVEECPRPLADVAMACYAHRINVSKKADQPTMKQNFSNKAFMEDLQQSLLLAERALLFTLNFNLTVEQPMKLVGNLQNKQIQEVRDAQGQVNPAYKQKFVQCVINFANDCARTTLPLQYPCTSLVACFLQMSVKLLKFTVIVKSGAELVQWFMDLWEVPSEHMPDIEAQMMELFDTKPAAPPSQANGTASQQQVLAGQIPQPAPVAAASSVARQVPTVTLSTAPAAPVPPVGISRAGSSPEEGELPANEDQQQQETVVSVVAPSQADGNAQSANGTLAEPQANSVAASTPAPAVQATAACTKQVAGSEQVACRASSGLGVSSGKLEDSANEEGEGNTTDEATQSRGPDTINAEANSHHRDVAGQLLTSQEQQTSVPGSAGVDSSEGSAVPSSRKRKLEDDTAEGYLNGPEHKRPTEGVVPTAVSAQ